MNKYYQHKETGTMFRVWHKSKDVLIAFKYVTKHYFDGLWESETHQEEIGTFKTNDDCLTAIVNCG